MKIVKKVSIIIRTCDRPLLLKRALINIFIQTYKDFEIIVINNGGKEELLFKIIDEFNIDQKNKIKVETLDYMATRGQALNVGICRSQGEYIAILDDDDTWNPKFLENCIEYLECHIATNGVATRTVMVTEKIEGNTIVELNKRIFNPQLKKGRLVKMLRCNLFTINAFVYRREVFKDVGLYREDLLALEDWEFNLRYMLKNKVDILPSSLAYYHKRINLNAYSAAYLNSGIEEHLKADQMIRKEYMLRLLKQKRFLAAVLIYVFGIINGITRTIKGVTMYLLKMEK
ncbi:glycosyltransferase family 2 protein [Paenibacillus terreus]|uniref:Glycosyltransferase family 2 protein n=1 Tax=Paenibacillus terreus TaxID=1387834 RepID=A0ABV5BG67_9BACL